MRIMQRPWNWKVFFLLMAIGFTGAFLLTKSLKAQEPPRAPIYRAEVDTPVTVVVADLLEQGLIGCADGSEPTRAYYAPPDKHAHHANTHSYSPVVVVCGEGVDTTWESTFIRIYVNDPFVEERLERLQRIALDYCASLNGGNAPANADCRTLPGAPAGWAPPTATPTPTPTPSPTPTPTPTPAPSG